MTDQSPNEVPFQAHVELLQLFLAHREDIVERLQGVLNAQRAPAQSLQNLSLLSRQVEDCFFTLAAVADGHARLRGQLEEAHWASGFRPRRVLELHNDLVHPAEMMRRAFHCWQMTRWPGRNGRVRYAHTLFELYLIRCLALLGMRVWDRGSSSTRERLSTLQNVLDELWRTSPSDQPALLRDARWLIPLAQSPTTEDLAAYFEVAKRVAEALADEDRLEIQKAHVQMIGGHLRSQIRHYCTQDRVSLDERSMVLRTRTSNALDFALLIQNLVPLLEAYEHARRSGEDRKRLELASAVCQGISPDPELFLNRIDMLSAYSMIEHLFVAADRAGQADYTPTGRRHLRLLREYEALIGSLAEPLLGDCHHFRPIDGTYSPYGVFYGTPSNLVEHMALKTIDRDAVTRFGLEDVFSAGEAGSGKLEWVNGWRKLPHIDRDVQRLHEYPEQFARDMFARIERALRRRVFDADAADAAPTGRLCILPADLGSESEASQIPDLPVEYIGSSDAQIVAAHKADSYDEMKLLRDRQEGHFAASYETPGGWVAIKKDFLTEVLGAGRDAKIVGLPPVAAEVLSLTCPGMVTKIVSPSRQASAPPSMLKA